MKRYTLIAAAVMCAAALAAPVASAQTVPLNATYTELFEGPNQHPQCPGGFACGSGTAAGLGSFTTAEDFDDECGCIVRTLTFSDGSTLVLDEDFVSFTGPGGSASSHAPGTSEGHPGLYVFSWTVDSGTGSFAGATAGNGADDFLSAGLIASGSLSGTITTS
jgi:hypothetical protein